MKVVTAQRGKKNKCHQVIINREMNQQGGLKNK